MLTSSSEVLFHLCLMFFSVCLCTGLDDQGRSRRCRLSLGLSAVNGRLHCDPQALPIASCLGDVITNLFWRQSQRTGLGSQGRRGTYFPTGAPQTTTLMSLGSELGGMVESTGAR